MPEPIIEESPVVEAAEPRYAEWSEYRCVGDDFALLWAGIETDGLGAPADARLHVSRDGRTSDVEPVTVTADPTAGITRFAFLVDRGVVKRPGAELSMSVPSQGRLELPAPAELPPLEAADVAIESVVARTQSADELIALMNLFERRCAIAERVADDLRSVPTESQKLAQAYREAWELRDLLHTREDAHQQSAAAVEAAEAAADERDATIERLEAEVAAGNEAAEMWQSEVTTAREQLAAAITEAEQRERDLAEAVEAVQDELAAMGDQAEAWATEAERASTQLAEAVDSIQAIQDERDAALASAAEGEAKLHSLRAELEIEVSAARVEFEAAMITAKAELEEALRTAHAERDSAVWAAQAKVEDAVNAVEAERDAAVAAAQAERDAAVRAAQDERNAAVAAAQADADAAASSVSDKLAAARREAESAHAVLQDAAARTDELARERDDERDARTRVEEQLARSQAHAADTEGRLEREQALYEARIASAVETERKLRRQVEALEAKLSEQPRALPGMPRRKKEPVAQQFADAQRARLRETTLEEQRAQVAALERQLEDLKQRPANRERGTAGVAN